MTRKGVESRLDKALFLFLKGKGFRKKSEAEFEKELTENIVFNLGFNIRGYPPNDFSVQTIFGVKIKKIDDYWVKYRAIIDNPKNPYPNFISFLLSYFNPELDKKYHTRFDGTPIKSFGEGRELIKTEEDIYIYIYKFEDEYEKFVIPFIKKAVKIEWIDEQINSDYLNFRLKFFNTGSGGLVFRKLIVAKLVDNPNFEEMYQAFRKRWIGWLGKLKESDVERIKNHITVLDKVYNDLNSMDMV